MLDKEYSKITITDIVNKANLGRTTFYRNFDCIDDVLKMKCDEKFNEFRKYCIDYYKLNNISDKSFLTPFLNYWFEHSHYLRGRDSWVILTIVSKFTKLKDSSYPLIILNPSFRILILAFKSLS